MTEKAFKRVALIFLLLLTIGICLHVSLHKHPDNYLVYITAVENILHDQNPYALQRGLDYFKYSPLSGLIIYPFSLLIDEVGSFLFVFLQFWLFFYGFWRWAGSAGYRLNKSRSMLMIAFISVITDTTLSIQICQVNAAIFGLMLLASAQYSEGKYIKSGLLLSLATNLKLFPFTLGLCFLLGFKKKYWLAFWGGLVFWFMLPGAILGFKSNFTLLRQWYELMTWDQTRTLEMLDIGNFIEIHFGLPQALRNPMAILFGLLIGLGTLYLFRKGKNDFLSRFLLPINGLYVLIFSYLSESATSILATTAIFLIGMTALHDQKRPWIYWICWIAALALIPLFYSDLVPNAWLLWARGFHLKTVGYLFVAIVLGVIVQKNSPLESSPKAIPFSP